MRMLGLIGAGVIGVMAAASASAMPVTTVPSDGAGLTLVRDGCGFGAHQGRFGGCRLNHGWRGRMRGAAGGAPRGCPPGTHPTGRGFCRRNGY